MKPLVHIGVLLVLVLFASPAVATDVSGDQSGTWTLDQSPYYLVGDVRVPPGETLIIEPGVEVIALGHYKLLVDAAATLLAVGTADQPILMTAEDHGTGWRGIRMESADDSSVISYCTIEYAKGTGGFPEVRGGAIFCKNCSPTISQNVLRYNYSHNSNYNGTGAGVTTESSNALILNNLIHDNQADSGGGVCCMEYGTPLVLGNVITDNTAYNGGGGIYMGARSSPTIERNVIVGNNSSGWGGGGINSWTSYIFYGTFATIRDNFIVENTTSKAGGGLYCRYDRAVITGNTIAYNYAGSGAYAGGGGIYALNQGYSAPQVSNCVLWGNTSALGAQIRLEPETGSLIVVRYSDVQDGWDGTGNIDQDPVFVGPDIGDYHLSADSPCIDAGDPYFTPQPDERDIDGQERVWDGDGDDNRVVDMGCDEFGSRIPGDLNGDGCVDQADLGILLADWGCQSDCVGDLDFDDDTDQADLGILLANWGAGCP